MAAIVLAHLADLVTFLAAASVLPIEGEGNPLARYAYSHAGPWGVVALKVAGIALVLWVLNGVADSTGKSIAVGVIAAMGLLGAATNLGALALSRS